MDSSKQQRGRRSSRHKKSKVIPLFTSYFRKKKRREQEKKEDGLRVYQEKLKEVLQPVRFSDEEEVRLRELKQHKKWKRIQQEQNQRLRKLKEKAMPSIPEKVPVTLTPLSKSRDLNNDHPIIVAKGGETFTQRSMAAVHQHTWEQRVAIVGTLVVFLFISLHADAFGRNVLPPLLFLDNKYVPWWVIVLKDCGRFCHMSVCSLIHFAICDISLIYAFESMELGTKTGPTVKKFYREKVHLVVAAVSGGIVALSICKALLLAWYRMLRDLAEITFSVGRDWCYVVASVCQTLWSLPDLGIQKIWTPVVCTAAAMRSASPSKWISSTYAWLARVLTGLCIWILALLIPFKEGKEQLVTSMPEVAPLLVVETDTTYVDELARSLNATLNCRASFDRTLNITLDGAMNSTLNTAFDMEVDLEPSATVRYAPYWRDDAFDTCRYLLSHSAIFLVAFLVALNVLTKSYRHKDKSNDEDIPDVSVAVSSIRTSDSLANDETHLVTNLSMETTGTMADTISTARPTSITVTIPVSSTSFYGGSRNSRGSRRKR